MVNKKYWKKLGEKKIKRNKSVTQDIEPTNCPVYFFDVCQQSKTMPLFSC
jgi:hypothetical protein